MKLRVSAFGPISTVNKTLDPPRTRLARWVGTILQIRADPLTLAKPSELIDLIHSHSLRAGIAISPQTSSSVITSEIGEKADLLLVMTVNPGRGGQKFMPECLEKVKDLRTRFPGKNIQVDGGVGAGNACQCAQAGESCLWFCLSLNIIGFLLALAPYNLWCVCQLR